MNDPRLGDKVVHRSPSDKAGIVTAICIRSYGTSYAVTWSDLTERWHAADELILEDEQKKEIKMPTHHV